MAGESIIMIAMITAVGPIEHARGAWDQPGILRVGQLIEARVESIDENGMVRLRVAGMALDVSSPTKLAQGSMIELLVKQVGDGSLTLVLKRPDFLKPSTQPHATHGSISPTGARGQGLLSALLNISAALAAANPASQGESGPDSNNLESLGRGDSPSDSSDAKAGTPQAYRMLTAAGPDADWNDNSFPRLVPSLTGTDEPRDSVKDQPGATMPYRGALDHGAGPPPTVINYFLPGTPELLQIAVTHHEDDRAQKRSVNEQKIVKARFTIDSDALGRVHVVMRQQGSAISVDLWAETSEVAAELLRERADLRDALDDADVDVGAIDVFVGDPYLAVSRSVIPGEGAAP